MPIFDYLVTRSNTKFDLGAGGVDVPHGTRLHGDLVESWGQAVADRLVGMGILAPVPHDPSAHGDEAPLDEVVPDGAPDDDDEPRVEDSATLKQSFPHHVGGGRFELSDGSTVVGKQAAQSAQAKLELA